MSFETVPVARRGAPSVSDGLTPLAALLFAFWLATYFVLALISAGSRGVRTIVTRLSH